jgi:putative glycosyltransferase (TIGR04372 family)
MELIKKIIYLLNRNLQTIVILPSEPVGNRCEELYYGLLKARKEGKKVIFCKVHYLFPELFRCRVTNNEVLNIDSPYISKNIFYRLFFELIFTAIFLPARIIYLILSQFRIATMDSRWLRPAIGGDILWTDRVETKFSWENVEKQKWDDQLNDSLLVGLTTSKYKIAKIISLQMGIKEEDWFVCVHVREGGFHNDLESESYRCANISSYLKAFKIVTEKGGWVVRMGDNTMTPLPKMERVIDYANSSFKSELMDVFLISECKTYCGFPSGIWDMAILFQKPIISANMTHLNYSTPPRQGDLGISKHVYSLEKNRLLSVKEILEYVTPIDVVWGGRYTEKPKFIFIENTEVEISELFKEFFDMQNNHGITNLQKEFNDYRLSQGKKNIDDSKRFSRKKETLTLVKHKYRFASLLVGYRGNMSHNFLELNWENNSNSISEIETGNEAEFVKTTNQNVITWHYRNPKVMLK